MSGSLIQKFNKRLKFLKEENGSFLIEALLATIILSVGITVIIQSMVAGLKVNATGAQYTVALNLIENKAAKLRLIGLTDNDKNSEGSFSAPNDRYRYSLERKSLNNREKTNIDQVHLKVSWDSGKRNNQLGITTYIFNDK